jgi:hypothetical protein
MKKTYKKAVLEALERTRTIKNETLTEEEYSALTCHCSKISSLLRFNRKRKSIEF